jgi:spore coat polysaccharide biosynthesis predicted glycosyltransferase SpsG
LYIGAGGGAILERIMMKLPSVTIAVAENQIEPLKYFSKTGASIYLAADESFSDEGFKQAILQALIDIKSLTKNCEILCEEFFSDRVHWLQKLLIKQSS